MNPTRPPISNKLHFGTWFADSNANLESQLLLNPFTQKSVAEGTDLA